MDCTKCQAPMPEGKLFCPKCGFYHQKEIEAQPKAANCSGDSAAANVAHHEVFRAGGYYKKGIEAQLSEDELFCPKCGYYYEKEMEAQLSEGKRFCPKCGYEV